MKLYYLQGNKSQFLLQHGELPEGFDRELEVNGYVEVEDEALVQKILRAFVSDVPEEAPVEDAPVEEEVDIDNMNFFALKSYAKSLGVNFDLKVKGPELKSLVRAKLAEK